VSPRRKQSTKELGAILNEAVPLVVAEEVQLPPDSPLLPSEEAASEAGAQETLSAEQPVHGPETVAEGDMEGEARSERTTAAGPAQEPQEPVVEPVLWRKSTIPFREDQYQEIGHVLAEFHFSNDVQLTIAEVVRLGLDKMIEALKDQEQREQLLVELYRQQRRESQGNENLKHSKSRGLGDYLATHGLLPN
jgi:hypothetical protein